MVERFTPRFIDNYQLCIFNASVNLQIDLLWLLKVISNSLEEKEFIGSDA